MPMLSVSGSIPSARRCTGDRMPVVKSGETQPISPLGAEASRYAHFDFAATLLAIAGHDLRQPLQLVTSAHEVLATTLQMSAQPDKLACAEPATLRLAAMLNQLVEAAQLHELAPQCRTEPIALGPVLDDVEQELSASARSKDICPRVARSRRWILSHPVLLRGMLRNLVRNAIDYTPQGGRVVVTCRCNDAGLRILLRDNGPGIHRDGLVEMFGPFRRGDKTSAGGLGLGLFIVMRAAELLNHRIEVRSVPGRGSCLAVLAEAAEFPVRQSLQQWGYGAPDAGAVSGNRAATATFAEGTTTPTASQLVRGGRRSPAPTDNTEVGR
jgi:two-component system phosphate regulon sensor histidine kinase PhoR